MFSWKTTSSANLCSCKLSILLFLPYSSTSALQMIEISSILDYMLLEFLDVVLRTQVDYNSIDSSDLIFHLDDFHLHKKYSHGSSELVCSGLVC